MNREDHLAARFKQIGYEPKSGAIAYNLLSKSLQKGEKVLYLLEGSIHNTLGYLIATERRVFYAGINKYKKSFVEHLDYEDILNVESLENPILPSVEINIISKKGNNITIKGCEDTDGGKFVTLMNYLCRSHKE